MLFTQKFVYIYLLCNQVLKFRVHHDLDQLQYDRDYARLMVKHYDSSFCEILEWRRHSCNCCKPYV